MIQSVARQPELKGELQGIQWLGFALTEAVVFYGLHRLASSATSSSRCCSARTHSSQVTPGLMVWTIVCS